MGGSRGLPLAIATVLGATLLVSPPAVAAPVRTVFSQAGGIDLVQQNTSVTALFPFIVPDSGNATPYPATLTFSTVGTAVDVNVTLKGLTHGHPDDLDVLLVAPDGRQATVMSDVGGDGAVNGIDLTLDEDADFSLPDGSGIVGGMWRPTNYDGADTFAAPAPPATGNSSLASLEGAPVAGEWRLFLVDDSGGFDGSLTGWGLALTRSTRPYPSTVSVSGLGAVTDVDVRLSDVVVPDAELLDLMLVGPQGQRATVFSEVGGTADLDHVDLVLDDEATTALPDNTAVVASGRYRPANYGASDFFPPPAPPDTGLASLSVFDGTDPNGTWELFGVRPSGVAGRIDGWSLDIEWGDAVAPGGTMTIAGGAAIATSPTVALSLAAVDPPPGTGLSRMRFSNDGTTWSPFQAYAPSVAWTLAPGDGTKTVFAQLEDQVGNLSAALADTIRLDTLAPRATAYRPTGKRRVRVRASMTITSSEGLEPTSVTKRTVKLTRVGRPGKVRARLTYDAGKLRLVLDPKRALARGARYRVTVTPGVVDLAGRPWDQKDRSGAQPLTWTFRTRS